MKRLAIGLTSCALGLLLYAVNWLGAVLFMPQVTEWDGSRLSASYSVVGHRPLVFGVLLLIFGAALVVSSLLSGLPQPGQSADAARELRA